MSLIKHRIKIILLKLIAPYQRAKLQRQVHLHQHNGEPIRVVFGAGRVKLSDWILTDIPIFDVLNHSHWQTVFPEKSINRALAEHVFEHLTDTQFTQFLENIRPYLASDGQVRIAVPDGFHPSPEYIEHVRPGGSGAGADDHKILYTYTMLQDLLDACGYSYQLLEYFDENQQFHQVDWAVEDGLIRRSAEHDPRNQEKPLSYTSLIIDFWVE